MFHPALAFPSTFPLDQVFSSIFAILFALRPVHSFEAVGLLAEVELVVKPRLDCEKLCHNFSMTSSMH